MKRASLFFVFSSTMLFVLCPIFAGCSSKRDMQTATVDEAPVYTVQIDRSENGAATGRRAKADDGSAVLPRSLAFEMVGEASASQASSTEARAAAGQAAILDAFVRSLIEARRERGQSTADFSARMGHRLAITHKSLPNGYIAEISLITGGVENVFKLKNGVLEGPPADMKLIRKLFAETNGEFSLLATDWSDHRGTCQARVACYLPAGLSTRLAAEPVVEESVPIP